MDLYLMRDIELQLRQAAEEIRRKHYPGWGNVCEQAADALANALDGLAVERARTESLHARLVAIEDQHIAYADDVGDALGQGEDEPLLTCARRVIADRDRLRAAGRALLACPHIAERDTDPDWVDAETEAAVAEMRAALKKAP